ncbi:MAG: RsmD family RNA methyltransferase [Burkholderiaceae bacterium]
MRIVGGLLRRTPLPLDADRDGLRPTPERVRATLFDWLGDRVRGARCLDPFCGTGALGLEALSRGAASLWLNDRHPGAVARLRAWLEVRREARDERVAAAIAAVRLTREDALALLRSAASRGESFDLILLDPPFGGPSPQALLAAAGAVLADEGRLYFEAGQALDEATLAPLSLTLARHGRAGRVHYHLLQRAAIEPPGP